MKGGISTYNSIKQELKYIFELEKYYYKYQKKVLLILYHTLSLMMK